jgi:hypothetical protein
MLNALPLRVGFENSAVVCQEKLRTGVISGKLMGYMLWLGCVRTDEEDAECDDPSRRMRRSIRCRNPPFGSHLYTKSDRFTMTGSGQTNTHRETLNQKRCLFCRAFELINNVTAPPRLHACAHTEPYWLNTCEPGTMAEATQWLNEQTENWRRRR